MKYSAAIDLSGKFAGFALAETVSDRILLSEHKAMQGRSSSSLSTWMLGLMAELGSYSGTNRPMDGRQRPRKFYRIAPGRRTGYRYGYGAKRR